MIGASVLLGLASAAMAEIPANYERWNAIFVSIDDTMETDATSATTASDDPDCSGQGHTVWYSFTPTVTTYLGADTVCSDYDTTLSATWTTEIR